MILMRSLFFLVSTAFCILLSTSCANKEIQQLQESVQDLDLRLEQYNQQLSRTNVETSSELEEVNQSFSTSLQNLRSQQADLANMIEQISDRLGQVERNSSILQERVNRLDSFSTETANLAQDLKKQVDQQQQEHAEELAHLANQIEDLRGTVTSNHNAAVQSINQLDRQVTQRINEMDESTRKVYRTILQELGSEAPPELESNSEYTGNVHVIQSGETLSKIASDYDVSMKDIQELNNIEDPSNIRSGQRIRIP